MNQSLQSVNTVLSYKSGKSYVTANTYENVELDFEIVMTALYKRFNCPFAVTVGKEYLHHDRRNKTSKMQEGKTTYHPISVSIPAEQLSDESNKDGFKLNNIGVETTLAITAVYDSAGHLSEILISEFKQKIIPRMVMQLIGLVLPKYTQVTKFTIKNCHIDHYTIHELSKFLSFSTITDVSLDDCPLNQANYDALLNNTLCLRNLSLCRCHINDEVCERLASKLCYLESAEEKLVALNLTSNLIQDVGVKHFAEALRSNRHLRYLNLADNLITDKGVKYIFNVLTEFPLTDEESIDRRHRFMIYLKRKHEIYLDCLKKLSHHPHNKSPRNSSHSRSHISSSKSNLYSLAKTDSQVKNKVIIKKRTRSRSSHQDENILMKAELMARQLLGPFENPYGSFDMRIENGFPICIGNFSLCYLNLAYNDLTYISVKNLLSVVEYQHLHNKLDMCGLMKVVLVGNYLPADCTELKTISHLLNKHMAYYHHSKMSDKGSSNRKHQRY